MTIIKGKSLIVSAVSSIMIALVLILTLVAYAVYAEFKDREFRGYYLDQLKIIKSGKIAIK